MGSFRDNTFKDEVIGHILLRSNEINELWKNACVRYALDESLGPFDEHPSHCGSIVCHVISLLDALHLAVSQRIIS